MTAPTIAGERVHRFLPLTESDRERLRDTLAHFLESSEDEVIEQFGTLEHSFTSTGKYVYVPGTREDRVLLVAHADVAREMPVRVVEWDADDVCTLDSSQCVRGGYTAKRWNKETKKCDKEEWYDQEGCLGADDRAGCTALWLLRDLGHSLLITRGEERGCIGARAAAKELKEELALHQFALEIDRRGRQEYVTYGCQTDAFIQWIEGFFVGYDHALGSYSDVAAIAPVAHICAINLAAGFMHEHTEGEFLHLDSWYETVLKVRELLLTEDLPRFDLQHPISQHRGRSYGGHGTRYGAYCGDEWDYGDGYRKGYRWNGMGYVPRTNDTKPTALKDINTVGWTDGSKRSGALVGDYVENPDMSDSEVNELLKDMEQGSGTEYCCRYGCINQVQVYGMCCLCAEEYMSADPQVVSAVREFRRKLALTKYEDIPQTHWTHGVDILNEETVSTGTELADPPCGVPSFLIRDPYTRSREQRELQMVACRRCLSYSWKWADVGLNKFYNCCSECHEQSEEECRYRRASRNDVGHDTKNHKDGYTRDQIELLRDEDHPTCFEPEDEIIELGRPALTIIHGISEEEANALYELDEWEPVKQPKVTKWHRRLFNKLTRRIH